jgi:CDP-diacylglycerol--glycerol-3-phosphate 3-phosphatidyltransferase
MVIIARELAVTALRIVAVERGVVIPSSLLGKAKTILQVAAIFAVIAFPGSAAADALLYAAVVVTVVSGADYFFGVRRHLEQARRDTSARRGSL